MWKAKRFKSLIEELESIPASKDFYIELKSNGLYYVGYHFLANCFETWDEAIRYAIKWAREVEAGNKHPDTLIWKGSNVIWK